jgi:hypothetical protein
MQYSGMLRRVALVRTDVSEEHSSSIIRMTRIGELGTTLAVIIPEEILVCRGGEPTTKTTKFHATYAL